MENKPDRLTVSVYVSAGLVACFAMLNTIAAESAEFDLTHFAAGLFRGGLSHFRLGSPW